MSRSHWCAPSELTGAIRTDVQWDAWKDKAGNPGAIIVRSQWKSAKKSNEPRRVYIPPGLCRSLRRRLEGPKDRGNHIFTSARGRTLSGSNLSTTTRRLRKTAIAQGLPFKDTVDGADCLTCYRWRHTAASSLVMRGVPLSVIGKLLGTSAAMIASTYGHILNESLADAASQL